MELGNVYEVFQIGDRVRVNDICYVYYGRTGTIVQIEDISYNTEPIYTIALDGAWTLDDDGKPQQVQVNAKSLEKIPRRDAEEYNITMGTRNAKSMKELIEVLKYANKLDGSVYSLDTLKKLTGGTDEMKKIDVEKIIFNGPKTIVFWTDGTKTIVSISKDEAKFDPEAAFCAAYTKKTFGTNSKIKRIISEKSNYKEWKEEADNQLYKLGLKALAKCEGIDIDIKEVERLTKEAEKFQDKLVQLMYDVLTGHLYEGEENKNGEK